MLLVGKQYDLAGLISFGAAALSLIDTNHTIKSTWFLCHGGQTLIFFASSLTGRQDF